MNNNKNQKSKFFSSKKFKYGASAVVFTAVFVAFVILLNVLVSFIDARNGGLYVDLTTKQLFGISDVTRQELEKIDKPVDIIFCVDEDKLEEAEAPNMIKMLAENYEREFDGKVSVLYKDKLSDPVYFNQFSDSNTTAIDQTSIIINCPSTGRFVIYNFDRMFKKNQDGELFAFDGEYKFTSAILDVARTEETTLKAGVITGHGEKANHSVTHYLEDYGYSVSNVDLKKISQEELASYSILIVCNPVTDYLGIGEAASVSTPVSEISSDTPEAQSEQKSSASGTSVNEIKMLEDYVVKNFGNIMFFFDPDGKELPELFSLLSESFGVKVDNLRYVDDPTARIGNQMFYGTYFAGNTESAGYQIHKNMSDIEAIPPVFGPSCSLEIVNASKDGFGVSPIMTGSENMLQRVSREELANAPYSPVLTVSRYTKVIDDVNVSGNVFVCGSSAFLNCLDEKSVLNRELFKQMVSATSGNKEILSIDFRVLDESGIVADEETIDTTRFWLVLFVPMVIAVIGIAVFVKRKYING